MTAHQELKARAKRARAAVSDILGVPCSESQSFKLIARIENFPSWEAAGASYKPSSKSTAAVPAVPMSAPRRFADHAVILGPTGSGLSTVVDTYLRQLTLDHNARLYAFDDRDGRDNFAFVGEMGGEVIDVADAEFHPLRHIDDEAERAWVASWIEAIVQQDGDGSVSKKSRTAIAAMLKKLSARDVKTRSLGLLQPLVGDGAVESALAPFCLAARGFGEVFDATPESECIGKSRMQVFALGKVMSERRFLRPTVLYLIHRIMQIAAADGVPAVIALDLRQLLGQGDEWLAERAREWMSLASKTNVAFVFIESWPNGLEHSTVAKAAFSACPTKIFLPNPDLGTADTLATYKALGITYSEARCIETATPKRDYCSKGRGGFVSASLTPGPDARIECKSVADRKPAAVKADVGVRLGTAWDAEDARRTGERLVDPTGSSKNDPFVVAAGLLVAAALLHVGYAATDRNEAAAVGDVVAAAQFIADPAFESHAQMLVFMQDAEHEAGVKLGWRDSSGKPTKRHPAVTEVTSMLMKWGDVGLTSVVMLAYQRLQAEAAKR